MSRGFASTTRRALTLAIGFLALSLPVAGAAQARVPQGWVGSMMDGPLAIPSFNADNEVKLMASSGVETVRSTFYWYRAQPYKEPRFVPPAQQSQYTLQGGVATTYAQSDLVVSRAAKRGIRVMPILFQAPGWLRKNGQSGSPPRDPASFANYATGLVQRYGPNGTFWRANPSLPKVPIRNWQIWNEPDFPQNWREANWQVGYAKLLAAGSAAIKAQDRGAKVVLAGIANDSPRTFKTLYSVKGVGKSFDIAAIHPYTSNPTGVITLIKLTRKVMSRNGDGRKPLMLTEFGWPSSNKRRYGFETTQKGQASKLKEALPLLGKNRKKLRLAGIFYYTWLHGQEKRSSKASFDFAGLRRFVGNGPKVVSKPAYKVFKAGALKLEGCKRKGSLATKCAKKR